ncbi:DUF3157 family protein [uncultured Algibacter sp.]|uniref:DUF3157 family protein n=1 Tax=uncultured Algibacter sp. TaxID=298659 RepID=UPI00262570B6|nr:DUF3157 family protein [uncultured Algibacter sp.]
MKKCILVLVFALSFVGFSQNNYIVKTEDGRRVLLKADYTWEYIDMQPLTLVDSAKVNSIKPLNPNSCSISKDFVEPKLNAKIQSQLKKGRATINHVKKKVAKDNNCSVDQVILLSAKEQKSRDIYYFCVNGTKATYKRVGNSIIKAIDVF